MIVRMWCFCLLLSWCVQFLCLLLVCRLFFAAIATSVFVVGFPSSPNAHTHKFGVICSIGLHIQMYKQFNILRIINNHWSLFESFSFKVGIFVKNYVFIKGGCYYFFLLSFVSSSINNSEVFSNNTPWL